MPVKSLSVPSGMLSLCCTLIRRDISNNDSSSPHLLCTVADKRLLNIAVSIYCLPVCSPLPLPIFHHAFPHKQQKKKKSPHSLWIGQEVVRGLLLSALPLACPWHLGFFVLPSTSRQKKKQNNPAKADKTEPLPVCLSVTQMFYLGLASVQTEEKNHRLVCARDYSAFFLSRHRAHLILSGLPKYLLAPKSFTLSTKWQTWPNSKFTNTLSHTQQKGGQRWWWITEEVVKCLQKAFFSL